MRLPSCHGFRAVASRTRDRGVHWREGSEGQSSLMLVLTLVFQADRLLVQATGASVLGSRLPVSNRSTTRLISRWPQWVQVTPVQSPCTLWMYSGLTVHRSHDKLRFRLLASVPALPFLDHCPPFSPSPPLFSSGPCFSGGCLVFCDPCPCPTGLLRADRGFTAMAVRRGEVLWCSGRAAEWAVPGGQQRPASLALFWG